MASSPPSIAEKQQRRTSRKHRRYVIELILFGLFVLTLAGVAVMLSYWPFRYRQVHPLLERTFRSTVTVRRYRRTYFPHPGYVAEGVTLHRHGDMHIPPLASLDRMTVVGTWTNLVFHPHRLYEIRLTGLHVQIPPAGTAARSKAFDQGIVARSSKSLQIETIVADGTTLDLLTGTGKPSLRLRFPILQVHNVQQGQPLSFSTRVLIPHPPGIVLANGSVGPFRSNDFNTTPLSGTYSVENVDLGSLHGISGHAQINGRYSGTYSRIQTVGNATIPDFRAASAHTVRSDATYRVIVNGVNGDVEIDDAQVRTGANLITASGSVVGEANKVSLTIGTTNSRIDDLLKIIERKNPSVLGNVTFHAAVELNTGPGAFLQRLGLRGQVSLARVKFANRKTQQQMNAFAARMQKNSADKALGNPPPVTAAASSLTIFDHGIAYFPNVHITFPGTDAYLHGTFNLLDTHLHFKGKVALQQNISHAATGWRSALLKPLIPFFRHRGAGAIVSIAVTGTAAQPKITQDVLHNK